MKFKIRSRSISNKMLRWVMEFRLLKFPFYLFIRCWWKWLSSPESLRCRFIITKFNRIGIANNLTLKYFCLVKVWNNTKNIISPIFVGFNSAIYQSHILRRLSIIHVASRVSPISTMLIVVPGIILIIHRRWDSWLKNWWIIPFIKNLLSCSKRDEWYE